MWAQVLLFMDKWLMPIYQFPDSPVWGFFLGTAVLAGVCVFLGDVIGTIAIRLNRFRFESVSKEMVKMNNLSLDALECGDGTSYTACNKLANESFGRMFFLGATLSMATLLPAPFALTWMQWRFYEVDFPVVGTNFNLGYMAPFILLYILFRILMVHVRPHIPFVRGYKAAWEEIKRESGPMRSWGELLRVPKPAAPRR